MRPTANTDCARLAVAIFADAFGNAEPSEIRSVSTKRFFCAEVRATARAEKKRDFSSAGVRRE